MNSIQKIYCFILSALITFAVPLTVEAQSGQPTSSNTTSFPKGDTLYVKNMILAKDVVERTPINVVQSFDKKDQEGWCFARLYNSGDLTTVRFIWYYEEQKYFTFDAKVGHSPNWRTYSSVTLRPGSWRVIIKNEVGIKMEEIRFHVSE